MWDVFEDVWGGVSVCVGCVRVFGVYEGVVCVRGYVGCTRGCVGCVRVCDVCDVCVCVSGDRSSAGTILFLSLYKQKPGQRELGQS